MSDPGHLVAESLAKLADYAAYASEKNPAVSAWSVGMQIHHALLAAYGILSSLIASEPGAKKQSLSIVRTTILKVGKIPRGRGKSPAAAVPSDSITPEEIATLYEHVVLKLAEIERTDPAAWWDHPMFGVMALDTALRFLDVHTRHHLAIIDDIRKS